MMESIKGPSKLMFFSGNVAEAWRKWRQSFELYLLASGGDEFPPARKRALFLHCIGEEGVELYNTMEFAKILVTNPVIDESKDLEVIMARFEVHCCPRKNVTFERYIFHTRKQMEAEPAEVYVAELRKKAVSCEFGELRDSLIMDQLILGVRNEDLRTCLLREGGSTKGMTLERAMEACRMWETSEQQMWAISSSVATSTTTTTVEQVHGKPATQTRQPHAKEVQHKGKDCPKCGRAEHKPRERCPTSSSKCNRCGKRGHWEVMCWESGTAVGHVDAEEKGFLGTIHGKNAIPNRVT